MGRGARIELLLFVVAGACGLYGFGLPRFGFPYEPPPKADALRIVTWNVGAARDFGVDVDAGDVAARVIATIADLQPDLCVLQEVSRDFAVRIATELDADRMVSRPARGRGVALLSWSGRLDPEGGDEYVHAVYRKGRRRLRLVGMHAHPWSATERNEEIGRAVTVLEKGRADVRVLAGDLNLDVDIGGGRDLFTEDEHLDVQTYNYVAERLADAAAGTGPTAEPDRRLDYVFVGGAQVRDAGVWKGRRVGAMDHHPVVVDLEWK
ncbi:MAG: endonuclease/exonuclease/phosphatase family protein [bacterium]|nr:endonuclease/exonuclease/phosphatase family protein [bacterium]